MEEHETTAVDILLQGLTELRRLKLEAEDVTAIHEVKFRRLYGSSHDTCSRLWNDLVQERNVMQGGPYFLLLTLSWLRNYQTELDLSTTYMHDEDTLRKYFWFYVNAIQSLKSKKVRDDVKCKKLIRSILTKECMTMNR
jgi:hypothetical protein